MTITEDNTPAPSHAVIGAPEHENATDEAISRPQRRMLRRIYNGRVNPLVVNDMPLLTYKEATRYLLSLEGNEREQAYAQMKELGIER